MEYRKNSMTGSVSTYTEPHDDLREKYYEYRVAYAMTLSTPEEGLWECKGCNAEFPEHNDDCPVLDDRRNWEITFFYPENPAEAFYTGETYHEHYETFFGFEEEANQQQCDELHEHCKIKEIEEATHAV
jgi:hypothetical protein